MGPVSGEPCLRLYDHGPEEYKETERERERKGREGAKAKTKEGKVGVEIPETPRRAQKEALTKPEFMGGPRMPFSENITRLSWQEPLLSPHTAKRSQPPQPTLHTQTHTNTQTHPSPTTDPNPNTQHATPTRSKPVVDSFRRFNSCQSRTTDLGGSNFGATRKNAMRAFEDNIHEGSGKFAGKGGRGGEGRAAVSLGTKEEA